MADKKEMLHSFLRIRKIVGLLGLFLPWMLVISEQEVLASISHYYYTPSSIFFTAILFSFGLLLISYRGYEKRVGEEKLSDNQITFIGGVAAIIVVALPTSCGGSASPLIEAICKEGPYPLFGHNDGLTNTIHLFSAGLFLFIMGWMSYVRFPKSKDPKKKNKNRLYKICGAIVWACILILGVLFLFNIHFSAYDVIIFEWIALSAFGLAWLVKGQALEDLNEITRKILRTEKTEA